MSNSGARRVLCYVGGSPGSCPCLLALACQSPRASTLDPHPGFDLIPSLQPRSNEDGPLSNIVEDLHGMVRLPGLRRTTSCLA